MADFNLSFQYLQVDEGGYSNNPADSGGETWIGISRKNFPNWDGWVEVDRLRSEPNFPVNLGMSGTLDGAVKQFYRKQFWRFDGITNQAVADKLFDEAVNMEGSGDAGPLIKAAQLAARYVGKSAITADGQYGPQTESLINSVDPAKFLAELRAQLSVYYCKLNNPNFLLGWMRRAAR